MAKTLLTTGEIARHCQVTQRTVHNWIRGGHLPTARTPGGHQRIGLVDFQSFLSEHRLPAYGDAATSTPPASAPGDRPRVLVVDDEAAVREVIVRALERTGRFELAVAADGFSAGLEVARFRPDVVTMDVLMPYMNGLEACRWIKQDAATKDTKVLVVSALPEAEFAEQAQHAGVDGWMMKPIRLAELGKRIEELACAARKAP